MSLGRQPPFSPDPPPPEDIRLPWNEQAERAVLGAVLLDPLCLDTAIEILAAGDFYRESHRLIFNAYLALVRSREPIDPVTVRAELEREGVLERVGGAAYLASLIDGLPRTANVAAYATIVHDHSLLRQVLRVAEELREKAAAGGEAARDVLDLAEKELFTLSQKGHKGGFEAIAPIAERSLAKIEELSRRRELVTGIATDYLLLDQMLSGLQPSDLVILAARPSMGKTALALNIAQNTGLRHGSAVGIFSLEMSSEQLFKRLLCGEARIDAHNLRTGRLSDEEWERLTHAYERLITMRMYIDDTPGVSPMEVRSKARRLKSQGNLDLLIVDYLQLMRADSKLEGRQQEISEISRSLKGIAKELDVPVLALSQLSRAPEQRSGDHRPQLSDLRESGAIEQDADVVMFIYRPEVYEKDPEKVLELDLEGKAEIIIAKQRNGPVGSIPLTFIKHFTRFENIDFRDDGF